MKKLFALLTCAAAALLLHAVPAHRMAVNVAQPDGDSLTISLVGDEYYHYNTTIDGYTVVNTGHGWEYARLAGQRLSSTGVLAHNASRRSASEQALLASLGRHLTDRAQVESGLQARRARDARNQRPNREPVVDYSSFRGLIVLINFNDKSFLMDDPHAFYDDMVNTKGFTGYYTGTSWWNRRFNECYGSMRDYFSDQSMGVFDPQFDVVGPVDVPYSCRECGDNYSTIFRAALDAIDDQVDFTRYDSDSNGEIDMVFFMVAGYAASYSGNSDDYLWPHMSYLYGRDPQSGYYYYLQYDGMYMGRYASSTEIYGWESYGMTGAAGIGTMCHEFSHVLGLPDLYDTDYSSGGGQSNDPGDWDVMAGGSHADQGRNPVGYSLWERHELGWTEPQAINHAGNYELTDVSKSNQGYVMATPVAGETFYFENRQQSKWDSALPGHGMLVARVDRTNQDIWDSNRVNANPSHNYYELVRSGGSAERTTFPGPSGVTALSQDTDPALLTWNGTPCDFALSNIAETGGKITFTVVAEQQMDNVVEDFETMPLTTDPMATGLSGRFAAWNFTQTLVVRDEHFGSTRECAIAMPGALAMATDVQGNIALVSVDAFNPSSTLAKLQLYYSTDQGASWNALGAQEVPAGETVNLVWRTVQKQPVRFRLTRTAGSKTANLYVDNLAIGCYGELTHDELPALRGDIDGNGTVDIEDVNILINIILERDSADNYGGRAYVVGGDTVSIEDVNALINILLAN